MDNQSLFRSGLLLLNLIAVQVKGRPASTSSFPKTCHPWQSLRRRNWKSTTSSTLTCKVGSSSDRCRALSIIAFHRLLCIAMFSAVENEQLERTRMIIESTDVDINRYGMIWSSAEGKPCDQWYPFDRSCNCDGFTPLDIAVMTLNIPLIKLLQSYGSRESANCKSWHKSGWIDWVSLHLLYCFDWFPIVSNDKRIRKSPLIAFQSSAEKVVKNNWTVCWKKRNDVFWTSTSRCSES